MSRLKKREQDGEQIPKRKSKVFHDSTNTKNVFTSELFRKESQRLKTSSPQLDFPPARHREKDSKGVTKYPDSATPKIDNRNKQRLQRNVFSNFTDTDPQERLRAFKNYLFPANEIETQTSSNNPAELTGPNKKDFFSHPLDVGCGSLTNLEQDAVHLRASSQKHTDAKTKASNRIRVHKDNPPSVQLNKHKDNEVKGICESRNKDKFSNKIVPVHDDNMSFDKILRGPHLRAPADAMGRPIVTKDTLERALYSKVDNPPVLKAMLESCRNVEYSERFNRMECDDIDQKSSHLVSLSTSFGVKMIDTSKSCSESIDGSDLTLMSSDEDDEEQLELPPGWKQLMSRSKNRPYYVHPDHGRTWYCPALIRRRKRLKGTSSVTNKSSVAGKLQVMADPDSKALTDISRNLPVESETKTDSDIQKSMDDRNSYEQGIEESESSNILESSHEMRKSYPSSDQTTSYHEDIPAERNFTPAYNGKSLMFSRDNDCTKQSQKAASPDLENCIHRHKNTQVANGRKIPALYDTTGDFLEHDSASTNSQDYVSELLEKSKTSTAASEFDDYQGFEADFSQANESPMARGELSPMPFTAKDDEKKQSENIASSEEGQISDRSVEINGDEDSSLWIFYPTIPRCSLQYLHKLVHLQRVDS